MKTANLNWCQVSIGQCVCMLWGKCGTGAGMWVALMVNWWESVQYFFLSDDRLQFLQASTVQQETRYHYRPGWLSNHLGLPSLRLTSWFSLTESPNFMWHPWFNWSPDSLSFNATIFDCRRRSQIIEDSLEPSCLSDELILKQVHWWPWTKYLVILGIWDSNPSAHWQPIHVQFTLC